MNTSTNREIAMPYAGHLSEFARFQQYLVGLWKNENFGPDSSGDQAGGKGNPLSYNIMPLPQVSGQAGDPNYPGYILKNFTYYETIRFNSDHSTAHPAVAPNRGGRYTQNARALFYDQKVHFAEGPAKDDIVHVENGSWISLSTDKQLIGPYDPDNNGPFEPGLFPEQPSDLTLAKQISVPHGNSVLALGSFDLDAVSGTPDIPDAPLPYPSPDYLSVEPYANTLTGNDNYQNPRPDWAQHTNEPLQLAVGIINPDSYLHWHVTTKPTSSGNHGIVTNIPFEQRVSKVIDYEADYWLLSSDNGSSFKYLAYTQTMSMEMFINGRWYKCPHITCNVLTKE